MTMTEEERQDAIDRINGMSAGDVGDMPYEFLAELTDYFEDELLIKLFVSRGLTKNWQQSLSYCMKKAQEWWFNQLNLWEQREYCDDGRAERFRKCLKAIDLDIACNRLITPSAPALWQTDKTSNVQEEEDDESLEELREQNEDLRERLRKAKADIKAYKSLIKKAKADIEAYESQGKGVRASMHALLITTLCHHLGGLPQNGRQSLSPILQKLYGYTESTSESALKHEFTQEDADALAKFFNTTSPKVSSLIKGMPQMLKQQNNERLRSLRKNN